MNFRRAILVLAVFLTPSLVSEEVADARSTHQSSIIDTLHYLQPQSQVLFVNDADVAMPNDSLSEIMQSLLQQSVDSLAGVMHAGISLPWPPCCKDQMISELNEILLEARKHPGRVNKLKIPRITDSVLLSTGKNYVMIVFAHGLVRSAKNYNRKMWAGAITQAASMNSMVEYPFRTVTMIDVLIADVANHRFLLTKPAVPEDVNPSSFRDVLKCYRRRFNGFFWPYPAQ